MKQYSKVSDLSWGWPEGSFFNSYYTEVYGVLVDSLDCSTTLDPYLILLSMKQGGIKYHFWACGMTRPGIEHRFSKPLANTLLLNCVNYFQIDLFDPKKEPLLQLPFAKWNASASSNIWTRVVDSTFYDDNRYAKLISFFSVFLNESLWFFLDIHPHRL